MSADIDGIHAMRDRKRQENLWWVKEARHRRVDWTPGQCARYARIITGQES